MGISKPNYTQIPNEVFDVFMSDLSGSELKILLKIFRNTAGWGKESDGISLSQLVEFTGLSRPQILDSIKILILNDLITIEKSQGKQSVFKINYNEEPTVFIKESKQINKKSGYIYFILNKKENSVKIGHTKNIDQRFNHIQNSNSSKLEILKCFYDDDVKQKERFLHNTFSNYKIIGEWFCYSDEIKTFIDGIENNLPVNKVNQTGKESLPVMQKTGKESLPTKESNININIASKENGVPAGAPTPKRKKLNSEQSIKLKELITLFAERYKYIYKGKSILLTGKEIGCIKTLASKQPIEEIKERIKYLEWKVERNPEYFSLTPSCLLNNYNKLTEARDRYDN